MNFNQYFLKDKLVIWGWWEGKNLGDQWIKKCMRKIFPKAIFIPSFEKNLNFAAFAICGGGDCGLMMFIKFGSKIL
ncbi:MAG: hypothetical protein LBT18_05285 [Endomicrobium sp.]|jgi:hypothetical protein|nr:hypothetical protein [Endomicrobium sp.]